MKKLLLPILFICSLASYGQIDFRPGYIILNNNDTTFGLINYLSDIQNSAFCTFKKTSESQSIKYKPDEISGYRFINGKYYTSKKIFVENNSQLLFLEFLIKGRANVYYCRTNNSDHYFMEKDSIINELDNSEHTWNEDGKNISSRSQLYKGVIKYLFQDCPSIWNNIDRLTFSKKSIISISKEYHERTCTNEQCIIYERKQPKAKFQYGISISYAPVKFTYELDYYTFNLSNIPSKGIDGFVKMNIPGWSEQFFLGAGLSYLRLKNEKDLSTILQEAKLNIDIASLGARLDVTYKIPFKKLSPYFNLGTCVHSYLKKSVKYYTLSEHDYSGTKSILYGLFGGIGIEYKIFKNISLLFSSNYENNSSDFDTRMNTRGLRFTTGLIF